MYLKLFLLLGFFTSFCLRNESLLLPFIVRRVFFSEKCLICNDLQLEESDKLLKRKQRFGIAISASSGDGVEVSLNVMYGSLNIPL